jgi:hypothetical protein
VLLRWLSEDNGPLAGRESLEIAFHTCGIDEKVPAGARKGEEAVGMGDQAAAGAALKRLGSISACSIVRVMIQSLSFDSKPPKENQPICRLLKNAQIQGVSFSNECRVTSYKTKKRTCYS